MIIKRNAEEHHNATAAAPLEQLLSKDRVHIKPTLQTLISTLAFEDNTALFGPYGLVLTYWSILTNSISSAKQNGTMTTLGIQRLNTRKCHMGKSLESAYSVPEVWI